MRQQDGRLESATVTITTTIRTSTPPRFIATIVAALLRDQPVRRGYAAASRKLRLSGRLPRGLCRPRRPLALRLQDSFAYQDANYGYRGYYVDQADYNYYFRQGFQRGYEDGFNNRYQYGVYLNGSYSVLGNVLSLILNLQSLQ